MVASASLALLYPTLLTALMQANYTIIPTGDGVPELVKLDYSPLTTEQLSTVFANVESTSFTLFTRKNPTNGQTLTLNNVQSILWSNWNANKPTIFVTHGWRSNGGHAVCTKTRDAFLKVMDCNVIVIDWSPVANNLAYNVAAGSVPLVAEHVARFVNFMRTSGDLRTATTKLIGHSLGAHVASLTARSVSKASKISEVVALDPAKPMFENSGPSGRVDKSHAGTVQVIHTCAGLLGASEPLGTADFYANDGRKQPGCGIDITGGCAHGRSYEYYTESITKPKGFRGESKNGGGVAYMGGVKLDTKARGSYYFKTNSNPPFAMN